MPARMAARVEPSGTGSPSRTTSPASGDTKPESTFISVDLPAPFSPSRPWMRPGLETEVDPVVGPHRPVALVDVAEFQAHRAGQARGTARPAPCERGEGGRLPPFHGFAELQA